MSTQTPVHEFMFIVALFTVSKSANNASCPNTLGIDKQNVVNAQVEYYLAAKKE